MIRRLLFVWLALIFFMSKNEYEVIAEEDRLGISPDGFIPFYSDGNAKVIEKTPLYREGTSSLEKVGTLEPGLVLTPSTMRDLFFVVAEDEIRYYIPKFALISTDEVPSFELFMGPKEFSTTIIAKRDASIRNGNGDVIGSIDKGKEITLYFIENGDGVIQIFGKKLYVDLKDFRHNNLVNPKKNISHSEMEHIIQVISKLYPEFTELVQIGDSVQGRPLYALRVGNGKKEILMDASMHAREHMTTNVLLEMMDEYIKSYEDDSKYGGFHVRKLLNQVSIWFVPMMNPDGVTLVQTGANGNHEHMIMNNGSVNFNRWKANIHGIDLNRNFDGGWMTTKTANYPSFKDYKGERAFSESESKSLKDFIAKRNFKSYITYHSSGSVIYYYHHQKGEQLKRDLALAEKLSKVTGYRIMPPTGDTGSGASADWFIMTYKMPGITMEIAPPIKESFVPLQYWEGIWEQNQKVGLVAADEVLLR